MSEEYTTKTWAIEHDWKCGHCRKVNKGREDKCASCGKPIDDTHEELVPSDMSYDNRVKDTSVFDDKRPDWICKYCNHRNRAASNDCAECGSDKSEKKSTVASGQVTIPGTTLPAPKVDAKGRPEYFAEYSHTSDMPTIIANPDYEAPKSERPKPTPSPSGKPLHYREPSFEVEEEIEISTSTDFSKLFLPVGIFAFGALFIFLLHWLFSWHHTTARVSATSWRYEVATVQRSVRSGRSWKDQEPAHSFNESCTTEIRSYHNCDPYRCNPHQVSYDCHCRSWQECTPRTSCRTVCSSSGTRSSSCSERCRTYNDCTTRRSCDTCYRTEYDTCYHRCPDYDQMCSYQYPSWNPVNHAQLSGTDHTPVRPTLRSQSNLQCPSDPEQLYISNNQVLDCHTDTTTFAVSLDAGEHGVHNFTPRTLTDYNQYNLNATWGAEYNCAGGFRILGLR